MSVRVARCSKVAALGRLLTSIGVFLVVAPSPPAKAGAIAAPTLQWQRGGCFASFCPSGWYSSPAVADLDGNGSQEVVWGANDLVAVRGVDGVLVWRAEGDERIWPGIGLADLDGNGSLEIVVGRNSNELTLYNASGGLTWTRSPFSGGEVRTLALSDLDDSGSLEIVAGRASSDSTLQVTVYDQVGNVRSGWPARRVGEPGFGAGMFNENIAIADFDGDGQKEIFAPTDTHYITALDPGGNQLLVNPLYGVNEVWSQNGVHVDHAADLAGFANCGEQHRPNFANAAPAIGDLDGDGTLELVVPGDVYNCAVGDPAGDLYYLPWIFRHDRTRWAASGFDWAVLPAPEPASGPLSQNFAVIENSVSNAVLADLDSDGMKEILLATYDGRVHVWWLDKTERHNWPFDVPGADIRFAGEPVVVDIDADDKAEVIFTSWPRKDQGALVGHLHVLDYQGNSLHQIALPSSFPAGDWNGGLAAPTLANIDGDANLEVVIGTAASGVVAYELPGSADAKILWGTGRGSYRRDGVAPRTHHLFIEGFEQGLLTRWSNH